MIKKRIFVLMTIKNAVLEDVECEEKNNHIVTAKKPHNFLLS